MVHFFPVDFPYGGLKIGPFMLDRGLVVGAGLLSFGRSGFLVFQSYPDGLGDDGRGRKSSDALSLGLNVKRSIAIAWACERCPVHSGSHHLS